MSDNLIIIPDTLEDRYSSFGFISWWEQTLVRAATVMVVGAGALGNEVIKNLALMGIGQLFIVDFDTIEKGNLGRSVLFRESDSGQRKAEVAARAVRDLNPDVRTQAFHGDINHELGLGVYKRMDVVIGCLDNREARLSINRACWQLSRPWIDGAIELLMGHARVFWPGRGACYECTLTAQDHILMEMRRSCAHIARENLLQGKVPTTPTAAAIIGAIQTQEALKIIHNMDVQTGTNYVFNGLTNDSYTTRLPVKADCGSHDSLDEIVEMDEGRADTTSLRQIAKLARQLLGEDAQLWLGHDLITKLYCTDCNYQNTTVFPKFALTESLARCPDCGNECEFEFKTVLTGTEDFADQPVASLGVPPLAIVPAFAGSRQIGVELTADAQTFFEYT